MPTRHYSEFHLSVCNDPLHRRSAAGERTGVVGAIGILRRILNVIRRSFLKARIRIRLDDGFAQPDVLDFMDAQSDVEYVVAMAKTLNNAR